VEGFSVSNEGTRGKGGSAAKNGEGKPDYIHVIFKEGAVVPHGKKER